MDARPRESCRGSHVLIADMRQEHHAAPLAVRWGPALAGPQATVCHLHQGNPCHPCIDILIEPSPQFLYVIKMNSRETSRHHVQIALDRYVPRHVVVETFIPAGEPSDAEIRVRPVKEGGFPDGTRVQCSRRMRTNHPIGSRFRIYLRLRETGDGPCLYAHHQAPYVVVAFLKPPQV